jgi:hypothetical protein
MDMKMSKLGPLNDLFRKDTVTFTSPNGEVVPVKSNRLAKVNPEKVEARKALDRAREALREAEEHYRSVSRDDEAARIKELDDFYRDKWVLEYDRESMMIGEGPIIKENFTITKVEKVTGIGNGFVSVKGKMLRVVESDRYDVPTDKKQLSVYTKTGKDIRITRVDQVLTENQLDKTLDKVRNNFFGKSSSIG